MNVQRVLKVREFVQSYADKGCLGVLAAQSRVAEGDLRRWLEDHAAMPSEGALFDIETVRELQNNPGGDPMNTGTVRCLACEE